MPRQALAFEDSIPVVQGVVVVTDGEEFLKMIRTLEAAPAFAFDFETSGLAWWAHACACGISFAMRLPEGPLLSWYVPMRHAFRGGPIKQLPLDRTRDGIRKLLEDPIKLKIAHNLKFDEHIARREGWFVKGPRFDTMIAASLYDENRRVALKERAESDLGKKDSHDFEGRVKREVARLAKSRKMGIEDYRDRYGYSELGVGLCGSYACLDAQYTWELFEFYQRKRVAESYPEIWATETKLVGVLCKMEETGLLVDREYLEGLRVRATQGREEIESRIKGILGSSMFKLGSDDQLRQYMLDDLKCGLTKLTKGKQLAVDEEVLSEFAPRDNTGVLAMILKWRESEKIVSTYTTSILSKLDKYDVLHGSFRQLGARTGRLSSSDPNLQNFSSDDDNRAKAHSGKSLKEGGVDPMSVRRAFVTRDPRPVRLLIDFSQIELRILAWYSKDPIMVDNYIKGGDIHKRTADEIGVDRRTAKAANFGTAFCLTEKGMSRQLGISLKDAEKFMNAFYSRYKGISEFRTKFWNDVRHNIGVFTNCFGRPRRIPEINSPNQYDRGRAERQAIASLIQGTAAELTKASLVRIDEYLEKSGMGLHATLTSTVHDEIWIDTSREVMKDVAQNAKWLMEQFPRFQPIPIVANGSVTVTNWANKKECF